ncbi:N-acetylneuraminate lyase-like isoform X1 [Acipenser ruthenus]|uniref:N-acetylneuraminate lyase-like isoform X1 n=1 Tax=Acipenser ruthenus TaxID=7906 RepID=UPI0027426A6A|nr:N-acetylneuraminate lyase-like isoform X1 [Acipenser ruthenus]
MAVPPRKALTGLVAATFTPMTAKGDVNLSVIGPYVDYLVLKQGIHNIFVNGTTGEGMSLSVDERKALAEEWCRQGKGKVDHVIVHVGCLSLRESQELARHAAGIGADGIAVISPSFFKPPSTGALLQFLQEVASAAPHVPFYYYHLPDVTGVKICAQAVLQGAQELIPSFQGLKFSSRDLLDFGQCVHSSPRSWQMLYGVDEQLLSALVLGAHGAVGSTYNYMGSVVNGMLAAFEKGDVAQARKIQFQTQEVLSFAFQLGFDLAVNKQLMLVLSGLPLGPPRLPLLQGSQERAEQIRDKLERTLGLLTPNCCAMGV